MKRKVKHEKQGDTVTRRKKGKARLTPLIIYITTPSRHCIKLRFPFFNLSSIITLPFIIGLLLDPLYTLLTTYRLNRVFDILEYY